MKKAHVLSALLIGAVSFVTAPVLKADFANPSGTHGTGGQSGAAMKGMSLKKNGHVLEWEDHSGECCEETETPGWESMESSDIEPNEASDLSLDEADTRQRTGTEEATANNPAGNSRAAGAIMGRGGNTIHHDNNVETSLDRTSLGRDRR